MPIWSLTAERLEKLKEAIRKKKAEYDDLNAKSDKDLWCEDLAAFEAEWERHLALNAEIQTNIRRMGRRVSKKIGAGGGGRGKKAKGADDDYEPEKKGRKKAAPKVETKTAQRFAEMFSAKPKVKKEEQPEAVELSDNFSDDDFAALSRSKPAAAKPAAAKPAAAKPVATKPAAAKASQSRSASEARSISVPRSISQAPSISQYEEAEVVPVPVRNKRAAASKARTLFDASSDSDEDDDKMLGDVGALVKGIGSKPSGESSARVSLHAMSRPDSSHGNTGSGAASKPKIKSAKLFDFGSDDETNYELLAKPSPLKAGSQGPGDDDEDDLAPPKSKPAVKASATDVKKRGRPAGAKNKEEGKAVSKHKIALKAATTTSTLSPAAKRYAAKKKALNDSDDDMEDSFADESIAPRPAARARPGRAAAANRKVIIDDEDSSMSVDEQDEEEEEEEEEESDDPFQVEDDD